MNNKEEEKRKVRRLSAECTKKHKLGEHVSIFKRIMCIEIKCGGVLCHF